MLHENYLEYYVFHIICFRVNDRIISANGISLENVEYATAVQVLRESGDTVSLLVKRRCSSAPGAEIASIGNDTPDSTIPAAIRRASMSPAGKNPKLLLSLLKCLI